MTEGEIAEALGVKPSTVSSMVCRAKKRGSVGLGRQPTIRLRGDLLADLSDEATGRGMKPEVLASAILRSVIDEDLYAAVLDL